MNYIGSKHSLIDFIYEIVQQEKITGDTLCDIFAGTHAVGRFFKKKGYRIIANDWQYYSYVLGRGYIKNNALPKFEGLRDIIEIKGDDVLQRVIDHLNTLEGEEGFIFQNYCQGGSDGSGYSRTYFTDANGKKCDSIRNTIQGYFDNKKITEDEYYVLLTALLESIDAVANTASVYGAFLKKYKRSSLKSLLLKKPEIIESIKEHEVYNCDAGKLIENMECDILYIDPPYNARQYASNYHLLETIAVGDQPQIYGKTGLRPYTSLKSDYCSAKNVRNAFAGLIEKAKAKHILVSYNSEGIMSQESIAETLGKRGKVKVFAKNYKRFRADRNHVKRKYRTNDDIVKELLFYLRVEN